MRYINVRYLLTYLLNKFHQIELHVGSERPLGHNYYCNISGSF